MGSRLPFLGILLSLALVVMFFFSGVLPAAGQTFDATALRQPTELATGWRVHAGDDPAYASPAFDDSQWTLFDARTSIRNVVGDSRPGVIWYRLHVKVSPDDRSLALEEYMTGAAFEVYVNGRMLIRSGSVVPFRTYTADGRILAPIPAAETATGSLLIAVRLGIARLGWDDEYPGYHARNLTLGELRALDNSRWLTVMGQNLLSWLDWLASLALGIVAFALYLSQRNQREYLWLFASTMLYALVFPVLAYRYFHDVSAWWELAILAINPAYLGATLLMYCALLRIRFKVWMGAFLVVSSIGILFSGFAILSGRFSMIATLLGELPGAFLFAVILSALLLVHFRRGNREAGILLIAVGIQSIVLYVQWGIALLAQIPFTAPVALRMGAWLNGLAAGPILLDINSIGDLLYVLCFAVIIVLRATRMSRKQAVVESELEACRAVQQILLPETIETAPGFQIESVYQPAQQVGGDFFQVVPDGEGGMLLVMGDVAGKGLPAAMLVSVLVGAFRAIADFTHDPTQILVHLNERLVGRAGAGFSTALVARITAGGSVAIANAGHLSPYLDGAELELPGALPLGVVSGVSYVAAECTLRAGSRLTFVSDGVVEAQNARQELFGFERTGELSTRPAADIAQAAASFGQEDDITVVTIERPAAERSAPGLESLALAAPEAASAS
jgi:hypothetical protein